VCSLDVAHARSTRPRRALTGAPAEAGAPFAMLTPARL
jgi:hypothetical protein